MIKSILYFFRILCFYVIFFAFWRLLFLLFNAPAAMSFNSVLPAFLYGARMDISIAAYLLLLPFLCWTILLFHPISWIQKLHRTYHIIIIVLLTLILLGNLSLFHFWGSLLNYRALTYLTDPREILLSLTNKQTVLLFAAMGILVFAGLFVFFKWFYRKFPDPHLIHLKTKALSWLMLAGLLIIGMRGGLQMLPMNESLVYYSPDLFLNQTAVNPVWHLGYDVYTAGVMEENPFEQMPEHEAAGIVRSLFESEQDSFPHILNSEKPNVVILILESFTADLIASMGAEPGISPNLDSLIHHGVLFSRIYSSGIRTDQGIVSVLNGWPATPFHSIMRSNEKSGRLPSLPKIFREKGYATSFYYGGESHFSNMNVYLVNQSFEKILEQKDFPSSLQLSKWGIPDQYVLEKQLSDLNQSREPFFSVVMTLSNHEPFEVPGPERFPGGDEANRFRNSAAYADACLGSFFKDAAKQPWYSNTLFILVADHGHALPKHRNVLFPNARHIPIVFFGNVLKTEFEGKKFNHWGGHHDIPGTLLPQLGWPTKTFSWSKNLLSKDAADFSYYSLDHILGWIDHGDWFIYSYNKKDFIVGTPLDSLYRDSLLHVAQAFNQKLYLQYKKY